MENGIGTATWFDLPVSQLLDAMSFYEALLGWQFAQMNDAPETNYVMIRAGDTLIGGLRETKENPPIEPNHRSPILYFTVDRLTPNAARAKELGAALVGGIVHLGKNRGYYQWFRDRDKNLVALWSAAL